MRRLAVLLIAILATSPVCAASPRPFVPGSFEQLLAARRDQPVLVVLWSITCAPCREEFELLAAMRKERPELPLVLISTDDIGDSETATAMLTRYALDDVESWIFADANAQRLRFEIDPQWYGEMPRSYLYDAAHSRQAISGSLKREQLAAWMR